MPTYDYRCSANSHVVEITHRMDEIVTSWGELCAMAGIEPGDTAPDAPVEKLITGGQVVRSTSLGDASAPSCASGPCCGGRCDLM